MRQEDVVGVGFTLDDLRVWELQERNFKEKLQQRPEQQPPTCSHGRVRVHPDWTTSNNTSHHQSVSVHHQLHPPRRQHSHHCDSDDDDNNDKNNDKNNTANHKTNQNCHPNSRADHSFRWSSVHRI